MFYLKGDLVEVEDGGGPTEEKHGLILHPSIHFHPRHGYFLLNMSMMGVGMNFMTVSTMLSSSSSSPQPVGTAFFGRVRLPSEACSIAAAASASFSSFFLMPYCTGKRRHEDAGEVISKASVMLGGGTCSKTDVFQGLVCDAGRLFSYLWLCFEEIDTSGLYGNGCRAQRGQQTE